ncbi:MAG: transcription factor FapR [Bacillota bacterium]
MLREDRQRILKETLRANPFLTDQELADRLQVSIQTIRLDRLALGIPELRARTREVAKRTYGQVKSLQSKEIFGELIDINLEQWAVSVIDCTEAMAFERSRVVRGHFIFAQADSLALALVNADVALTGLANIKFKRPVKVGEKAIARAEVLRRKGNKYVILVTTKVDGEAVFRGKFVVAAIEPAKGESV